VSRDVIPSIVVVACRVARLARCGRSFDSVQRQWPLRGDCVEKLADDYFKAIFAQRNFASSFFLESSLRCPRVADSNITDKNGCGSFPTQSGNSRRSFALHSRRAGVRQRTFKLRQYTGTSSV
jgi:hypothetical protein